MAGRAAAQKAKAAKAAAKAEAKAEAKAVKAVAKAAAKAVDKAAKAVDKVAELAFIGDARTGAAGGKGGGPGGLEAGGARAAWEAELAAEKQAWARREAKAAAKAAKVGRAYAAAVQAAWEQEAQAAWEAEQAVENQAARPTCRAALRAKAAKETGSLKGSEGGEGPAPHTEELADCDGCRTNAEPDVQASGRGVWHGERGAGGRCPQLAVRRSQAHVPTCRNQDRAVPIARGPERHQQMSRGQ